MVLVKREMVISCDRKVEVWLSRCRSKNGGLDRDDCVAR